jgi:hypothetical protein
MRWGLLVMMTDSVQHYSDGLRLVKVEITWDVQPACSVMVALCRTRGKLCGKVTYRHKLQNLSYILCVASFLFLVWLWRQRYDITTFRKPCFFRAQLQLTLLGALAYLRKAIISFVMFVYPSICSSVRINNSALTGRIITKFCISVFFSKTCRENSSFFKIWRE